MVETATMLGFKNGFCRSISCISRHLPFLGCRSSLPYFVVLLIITHRCSFSEGSILARCCIGFPVLTPLLDHPGSAPPHSESLMRSAHIPFPI